MKKSKVSKMSKIKNKKKYEHEDNEDDEDEEEADNEYVEDGFLVPDDSSDTRGYRPINIEADYDAPEAQMDSDFASSDYDVIDEKPERKSRKLKKGIKRNFEAEEKEMVREVREKKRNYYSHEEMKEDDDFIEKDELADSYIPSGRKIIPKSVAHNIFSLEEQEVGEEQGEEKRILELAKIYDKEELEEEYATQKDNIIKILDYPERLLRQYTEDQLLNTLNSHTELEAEWILEKIKTSSSNIENLQNIKKKIYHVLEYHKKDLLDIPFISFYKKTFEPELTVKDVWKIFEMDKEWNKIAEYKTNVRNQFSNIVKFLDSKHSDLMERRYINNAKSIRELKDMEAFICFMKEYYKDLIELQGEGIKLRPHKTSLIERIKENKIDEYARKFSLTSHELAINLELTLTNDSYVKGRLINPPEENEEPGSLTFKYIVPNSHFDQELKIMTNACKFLALEMFAHPYIRMYSRNFFRSNSTLTTEPTEEGKKELDVFNPSYRIKRIIKKPIDSFSNDLFLDIIQNESKGLILVKIECEEELKREISERINLAYNSDNSNRNYGDDPNSISNKWKIMREEAIRILIVEHLFPEFEKEIRAELFERAENNVIGECCHYFYNLLMTGPYKKQRNNYSNENLLSGEDDTPKVMSFVYDSSKSDVYCAMIDQSGELLDYHIFNQLASKPIKSVRQEDKTIYYEEQTKLKEMIDKYKPELIVIGANDLKCRYLKDQIMSADTDIMKNQEDSGSMWLTFGDLTVPKIFSNSPLSEKKMKNYNIFLKQAISLGRFKQNPLAEVLQLWNEDSNKNMCLGLPMHIHQKLISQNKLAEYLELKAIEVVNNVGVDINQVYEHPHLRGPLNFISGLGPRKAAYIMQRLMKFEQLSMRIQLVIMDIVGKKVFMNCSGFLKIRPNSLKEDQKYDLLDMTRIHPEFYPMAQKLSRSAAEGETKSDDHVELCLRDPKKFNSLELKGFIKKHEEKGTSTNVKAIINLITTEFNNPFKDPRPSHKDLTPSELFYMLIGDENIRAGYMVLAKVVKVEKEHVKCRLLNDLEATVWVKDIYEEDQYDKNKEFEMKEKYKEGMLFESRIKSINENSFKIDLSAKPSVLATHKNFMQVNLDKWFLVAEEDYINKSYQEEIKSEHKKYLPRAIKHPSFKNITFLSAIEYLRPKEVGEYVFRPSSKGINNITLSWKFYKHVYSHVDIFEEDKAPGAAIGTKLRISNDTYYSINEIIDRYVKPCEKFAREIAMYRKFCHYDTLDEFEKRIKDDKASEPNIVVYLFTILPDYPQYIILGYAPKINSVIKEFIKIKPKGYFFHDEYFHSIDDVVIWFKSNYGKDNYREYVKRIRPPFIEERRRLKDDPSEFNNFDYSNFNSDSFGGGIQTQQNFGSSYHDTGINNQSVSFSRPAANNSSRTCNGCGKLGHLKKDCPENNRGNNGGRFINNKRERSQDNELTSSHKERRVESEGWGSSSNLNTINVNQSIDNNLNSNDMQVDSGRNIVSSTQGWGSSSFTNENVGWGNVTSSTTIPDSNSNQWKNNDENASSNYRSGFNSNEDINKLSNYSKYLTEDDSGNKESHRGRGGRGRGRGGDRGDRERGGRGDYRGARGSDRYNDRNRSSDTSQEPKSMIWGSSNNENSGWSSANNDAVWNNTSTVNSNNNEANNKPSNETKNNNWNNSSNQDLGLSTGVSSGWDSSNKNDNKESSSFVSNDKSNKDSWTDINQIKNTEGNSWGNNASSNKDKNSWGENLASTKDIVTSSNNSSKDNNPWGSTTIYNNETNTFGSTSSNKETNPWGSENSNDNSKTWGSANNTKDSNANSNKPNDQWGSSSATWQTSDSGDVRNTNSHFNKRESRNDRTDRGDRRDRSDRGDRKKGCFNCGEDGHMSNSCPNPKKDRFGGGERKKVCFNCGEDGHMSRDCSNPKKEQDRGNFNRGGGKSCFNCGEDGHMSRECPNPKKEYDRGNSNRGGSKSCFNCSEDGHMSRDCPNPKKERDRPKRACYNCNEEGHNANDCPQPKKERERPKRGCFNCSEEGHNASDCPQPKKEREPRKLVCFNCNEEGHHSKDCSKPRDPNSRGRGRGGRGSDRGDRGDRGRDFKSPRSDDGFKSPHNEGWNNSKSNNQSSGWGSSSNGTNLDNYITGSSFASNTNNSSSSSGWGSNSDNNNSTSGGWGSSSNTKGEGGSLGNGDNQKSQTSSSANSGGWASNINNRQSQTTGNQNAGGWGANSNSNNSLNVENKASSWNNTNTSNENNNSWGSTNHNSGWN